MPAKCTWHIHCHKDAGDSAYCPDHTCLTPGCPAPLPKDPQHTYDSFRFTPLGQYCGRHTCAAAGCEDQRLERTPKHKELVPDPECMPHGRELDYYKYCSMHQCRAGTLSGGWECHREIRGALIGTPFCEVHTSCGMEILMRRSDS